MTSVVAGVHVLDSLVPYGCCEKFSRATFTLSIHRNPLYYIIRVVVPSSLLAFLSVFTYLLQPNRTERLAIGFKVFQLYGMCDNLLSRLLVIKYINYIKKGV